jgi:hypothetical protein
MAQHFHVIDEWDFDENGNEVFTRKRIPMSPGEVAVIEENHRLRMEVRAMKLINGSTDVRLQLLEDKHGRR